jgi:hypothetical protein
VMRWEEPHHPGPLGFNSSATITHSLPLCNTTSRCKPICSLESAIGLRAVATTEESHAAAANAPEDVNDLRGFHFSRLMRNPLTLVLIVVFTMVVGSAGAVLVGPAIGGAASVGGFAIALAIVFTAADRKANDAFFAAYAQQRGLTLGGRGPLPRATPLLRKGSDRYAERSLSGQLAPACEGTLALYTYEEKLENETNFYYYTLGLVEVPECVVHVPELYCQRKLGFRPLEKFEDVFRTQKARVRLESEALDENYEIFSGKGQDAVWLRRLFSPSFIVWLTEAAPKKFAFEIVNGTLCCYVRGHKEDAEGLDQIAAATAAVAKRLRDEALE